MSLFRDLLINKKKQGKPYYCEVEYLESTGTQYIDTGIKLKSTHKFDLRSYYGSRGSAILGCGDATNRMGLVFGSGQTNVQFFWRTTSVSKDNMSVNISFESWATIQAEANKLTVNGTSSTWTGVTAPNISKNILLFARTSGVDDTILYSSIRISYVKIYDGSTLVRDFIPVLDWNYIPCLYDKVSKQLFYNKGTGDFSYGREIHYVDYLESTGTQYIDTQLALRSLTNPQIEIECALTTTSSPTFVIGAYSTTTNPASIFFINDVRTGYAYSSNAQLYLDVNNTDLAFHYFNASYNNGTFTLSGDFSGTGSYSQICNKNLYLFARNTDGTATIGAGSKIKYVKIYNDGVLHREYVAAIDENGVGFMFDKVSHQCFLNAGTGSFKYPMVELEYLQSTGTQYIDTGLKYSSSVTYNMDVWVDGTASAGSSLFGARDAVNDNAVALFYYGAGTGAPYAYRFDFGIGTSSAVQNITEGVFEGGWCSISIKNRDISFDENGTIRTLAATLNNTTTTYDLFLLGINTGGSNTGTLYTKRVSKFTASNNGTLVCNFVPVYKDGVAGMWDKVNNVFYANAGTGAFTVGRIVE